MTDERLIEEAATAILASEGIEPQEDGTYWGESTWSNAVKDVRTVLAVFEKAHTQIDDEREAQRIVEGAKEAYLSAYPGDDHRKRFAALDRLAAGFRRTEVPEPSGDIICTEPGHAHCDRQYTDAEPQGEPSDADVEAGCTAFYEGAQGLTSWARLVVAEPELANRYRDGIRAALRAAGGVR